MNARQIECEIEGVVPLLMHRYPEEEEETTHTRKTGKKDYKLEFEKAFYKTEDGKLYQPATHIEQALVKVAANFQITGRGKKTYKDLFQSAVLVKPDKIPHLIQKHVIDKRSVKINRGDRIPRYRPRLDAWKLKFTINLLDDQIATSTLKDILEYAGAYNGLGDYRPRFGRFKITKFEEKT